MQYVRIVVENIKKFTNIGLDSDTSPVVQAPSPDC